MFLGNPMQRPIRPVVHSVGGQAAPSLSQSGSAKLPSGATMRPMRPRNDSNISSDVQHRIGKFN